MAPKQKANNELGTVVPCDEDWRVHVKLNGKYHYGPRREERGCADADLVAMRAVPRTEMAAVLAQLRTTAAQARSDAAADAGSGLGASAGPVALRRRIKSAPAIQPRPSGGLPGQPLEATATARPSMVQTLTHKGICIQYPFSQLILQGVKDVEVRSYPLAPAKGSHQFCHAYEDMFVIETRQRGQADVEGAIETRQRGAKADEASVHASARHRVLLSL